MPRERLAVPVADRAELVRAIVVGALYGLGAVVVLGLLHIGGCL